MPRRLTVRQISTLAEHGAKPRRRRFRAPVGATVSEMIATGHLTTYLLE